MFENSTGEEKAWVDFPMQKNLKWNDEDTWEDERRHTDEKVVITDAVTIPQLEKVIKRSLVQDSPL